MAKFKPGDKVIISKDSKNIWIRGKKGTIIRFLEEDNVPGSFCQWTYEVKLEDGDKSYVPQWEMVLEEGAKHHCIFEITHPNKHSECYFCKFVQDFGEDQEGADMMCESMNNFRKPDEEVWFIHRLLDQEEYDEIQDFLKTNPHGDVSEVYSPFTQKIVITGTTED